MDGLREAVRAFVATSRGEGRSKAEALEAVREVMTAPAAPGGEAALLPAARDALVELSSHWCSAEYEREAPAGTPSPRAVGEAG